MRAGGATMDTPNSLFLSRDLEEALASAGVGVWSWVVGSTQVRWSPEIEGLFGLAPGSFEGTFESYLSVIHPGDVQRVKDAIEAALCLDAPPYHLEHRIVVDGHERWLECRGRVERSPDGLPRRMLGTVMDVTARKEAERAAELSVEVERLISELANDYVYLMDREALAREPMLPQIVAGSFERVVGLTIEQLRERGGWLNVIHPEDRHRSQEVLGVLRKGQPLISEYRIIDGAGTTRWLRDTMRPMVEDGQLVRLAGGVKDITREKQLEQQWLQAQKLEALARLAGGIAHDFNNVMAVIHSGLDVVVAHAGGKHDHVLDDVRDAAQHAGELTRGLLSFARKPLGTPRVLSLEAELLNARPVLVRGLGERYTLAFEHDVKGLAVRIEPGQLQVLLLNLAINARDAMPDGGAVRVRASTAELVESDARRPAHLPPGRYFLIEVEDTGVGMPPEVLTHLFEPFFSTKGAHGTGLGLASCHGIAMHAGGGLTVSSAVGQGSTFRVVLPIDDAAPEAHAVVPVSVGGVETLLLVEDEVLLRRVARRALSDRGYRVLEAGSAEEALQLPAEQLAGVRLLIADVGLPGMDGPSLARALSGQVAGLKVVLTSGYIPSAATSADLERGDLHFLPKPFSADGLARRVREVLDARLPTSAHL